MAKIVIYNVLLAHNFVLESSFLLSVSHLIVSHNFSLLCSYLSPIDCYFLWFHKHSDSDDCEQCTKTLEELENIGNFCQCSCVQRPIQKAHSVNFSIRWRLRSTWHLICQNKRFFRCWAIRSAWFPCACLFWKQYSKCIWGWVERITFCCCILTLLWSTIVCSCCWIRSAKWRRRSLTMVNYAKNWGSHWIDHTTNARDNGSGYAYTVFGCLLL